jgi:predicted DNA-binding transcriptional regulator YafY
LRSQYDCKVAARTLERDLGYLRDTYGIDICYDAKLRGYVQQDMNDQDARTLLFLMAQQEALDSLRAVLRQAKQGNSYLVFEHLSLQEPLPLVRQLLEHIVDRRLLSLDYQSFAHDTVKTHVVEPYLLRQSWGLWYLLAWSQRAQNWIFFALDRIRAHSALPTQFERRPQAAVAQLLQENFGAFQGEPEPVRLQLDHEMARYVKALPLHISQQLLHEDAHGATFALHVAITPDLVARLLSFGSALRVLAPAHLRQSICQDLAAALAYYTAQDTPTADNPQP